MNGVVAGSGRLAGMGGTAAARRLPSRLPLVPLSRRARTLYSRPLRAPLATAALAGNGMGAAAKAAMAVQSAAASLQSAIDPVVLAATTNASFKLFLICAVVGWLLKTGRIPNSTATVMSKISFELLIPAMLFSKVAATLAAMPDPTLLLGIAAMALLQIGIGAVCGLLLAPLLGIGPAQLEQQQRLDGSSSSWRGRSSPEAASAIAASMAAASGAPLAARALRPKQPVPVTGPWQMVAPSAAFGNSFTLPAIFFATLLPGAMADRALGYAALFLLAWSPCLWSIGLALVDSKPGPPPQLAQQAQQAQAAGGAAGQQQQQGGAGEVVEVQPPQQQRPRLLAWRQPKVVDVIGVSVGSLGSSLDSSEESSASQQAAQQAQLAQQQAQQAQQEGEPPSWLVQLAEHPATARLCQFASQVLNPPVLAILAGTLVGFSPVGRALLASATGTGGGAAAAAAAALPPELGLLHSCAKAALEVIELLAAGTLATQTLVLAASLLQQPETPAAPALAAVSVGPASAATAASAASLGRRGWLSALRQQLLPSDSMEARALLVLALTRFLLVPLATMACLQALAAGGLLPPVLSDPVLLFVLLVEACMPSAQNLIILLQLSERTQALAPAFARLLLKLYFWAILPCTLWVTAFATNLGLALR
ncbi:auxin efflux carrier family [Chlorella sorokiniana]|uniref:Auxin efflux carrier family n=1 Tax=Chlorella sorokiniana TaxID=3076 RepID=A0A2P6TEF1_CHLSO|nr:auxin efflux carrier family [Chlorella sorokiniana]|eukprot:PRW21016.1 auxin efflux carrier family [Chlorella sorokiniana]